MPMGDESVSEQRQTGIQKEADIEADKVIKRKAEKQTDENGTGGSNILEESRSRCQSLRDA